MALLLTPTPRTRQPQGGARPSPWALSRGIGSLLLPSAGLRDIVDGGQWTSWGTAPTIGTGRHGVRIDSTAAFGGLILTPRVNQATAAQTHILLVETTAVSGAYAGLLACASSDGSGASLSAQRDGSDSGWATFYGASPTYWSSPTAAAIGPSLLILTGDAAGSIAYLDGVAVESSAGAPAAQSNSRLVLGGERSANSGYATKARIYLYAHLTQRLTAGEVAALTANPWQLFAPLQRRIWVPGAGGGGAPQLLRPASDISAGAWTPSSGSDLYAMLDETAADDGDYIVTTSASTAEVALAAGTDPASSSGHVVRYRAKGTGALAVDLYQGATLIATHTPSLTEAFQTFSFTLSGAEADSITDYAALRLRFTSS